MDHKAVLAFLEAQVRYFERLGDVNNAHADYVKAIIKRYQPGPVPPHQTPIDMGDSIG